MKKIDSIFLNQLLKDSRMLRDIHEQQKQNHMEIDYEKLISRINNSSSKEYFELNSNLKNKIIKAAKGDFSLKRSRDV